MNECADILLKPCFFNQSEEGFECCEELLKCLSDADSVKVGMEASGHYWLHLYYFLKDAGWEVEVFNPVLSNIQRRANLRGRKSDKDDTINIAKVLRDGGYHPWHQQADQYDELKMLCRQKLFFTKNLANCKRHFLNLLCLSFPELSKLFSDPYCVSALGLLEQAQSADQIAEYSTQKLSRLLAKCSKNQLGLDKAKEINIIYKELDSPIKKSPVLVIKQDQLLSQNSATLNVLKVAIRSF